MKSIALIDHWTNYKGRFSENSLPDAILVMDDLARKIAIKEFNSKVNIVQIKNYFMEGMLSNFFLIENKTFDFIFANINKNILLSDLEVYNQCLNKNGHLFMSGFYLNDLKDIQKKAESLGLEYTIHNVDNEWVADKFTKT